MGKLEKIAVRSSPAQFAFCDLLTESEISIGSRDSMPRCALLPQSERRKFGMTPASPALAGGFFTTSTTWEALVLFCEEHKIHKEIRVFPPRIKLPMYVNKLFP